MAPKMDRPASEGGAVCDLLAGGSQTSHNNPGALQQRSGSCGDPAWVKYLPSVDALHPCASELERRQRAGLMLLRDLAGRDAARVSADAGIVLDVIEALAARHVFSSMPIPALLTLRLGLVKMFRAARAIDDAVTGQAVRDAA
ncbi:MAG: hypothetical protein B7Y98_06195 [Sphingomonas sp. 32-62-10]|nr:MAG: hypothetical protein B7Y98_06195 [Sphingomonas sp. 32-62-10]